mgnify:CR=1 FL=1
MTPTSIRGITKDQWFEFEMLRRSGKTNMWGASRYLGFNAVPIMNTGAYEEMKAAWGQEFENEEREA